MKPFNIFDCNSSIQGKFFLEASAGTGKTFTIEQIVLRALIEGSLTHIEHALAITFTNAATNELKVRIKNTLSKILRELKAALNSYPASLPTYLDANCNVKQIYMQVRNALATLDQMSLFTIHGFCNFILEQYFPKTRLIHKNPALTHSQLILHHINNYLKQDLWKNVLFHEQFHLLAVRYNVTSKHTSSLIDKLLASYTQRVSFSLPSRLERLKQLSLWHQQIYQSLLEIPKQDFLNQLIAHTSGFKKQPFSILDDLHHFVDLLYTSETHSALFSFFKVAETFSFKHRLARYKPCNAFTLLEKMSWIERTLEFCNINNIFNTLLLDIQCYLKQNYTPWLSPDESIFALEKLFSSSEAQPVVHALREQYQLVLIDEFQDTDKQQWSIFSKLFISEEFAGSVFLIGDPKQSIYEWRNADLPTYLKAKSSFSETNQLQLVNNYRSTPKLMEAINKIFKKISPFLEIPGYPSIEYHSLNPQSIEKFENSPHAPVHFFFYENIKNQALWIFSEALRLQKEQKIPLGDMVVLVSDSKQAFELISYATIPVSFSKNKSIFHLTETYILTVALLEAILHPENYEKISKILLSSFFGLSLDEVTMKKEDYTVYFQSLHSYIANHGLLATFYHLMTTQGKVLLRSSQGGLIFQEMEKLCGYLDTISSYPYHQLLHLKNFSETGRWEEELAISFHSEDSETLKITTIHSSKGLEYDIVFCPGIDRSKKNKSSSELLREMYVACTRAKKQLYLPINMQSSSLQSISALTNYVKLEGKHASAYDLAIHLYQEHPDLFSYSLPTENRQATTTFNLPPLETFSLKEIPSKTIFSFSSTKSMLDSYKDSQSFPHPKLTLSKQQLPTGEKTGILIHKILESIQLSLLKDTDYLMSTIARFTKHTHLEGFEETILTLLTKTFCSPLTFSSQTFSLSQVLPNKIFRETSFLFLENNELWQGVIDFFFEHEGKYYIIDWKTSFLGETSSDYSESSLAIYVKREKLDYQGRIYIKAVKKFLSQFDINDDVEIGIIFIRGIDRHGNGFFVLNEKPAFNPKVIQKYQACH
ncbi:exodeoxyribonuclease V subunit beta [Candidatus Chlamydia corallus]|uniref:exodeoxyribonuclease V subunit beta n=1 Tax=Candidatus Chlamydia corallus TaxID=2038470 RepID=UPI000C2FEBD0|nr:exodeoxyribonuclease V subunit beta [Candidatus Chlamydia corallus]